MRLRLAVGALVMSLFALSPSPEARSGTMPPSSSGPVQGQVTQVLQLGAPNVVYVTVRTGKNTLVPFLVGPNTVISLNGKPATMRSLQVGETVQGWVTNNWATTLQLWSITPSGGSSR